MLNPHPQRVHKWLVVTAIVAVASVMFLASDTPSAILLALIPLTYTIPAFIWLDQLEPEPRAMRWNAFLWGAGISAIVASVANELTSATVGLTASLVISAPVSEEIMKVLGISRAAKRHHIDSPLDGAIYAGYVGLGFATVENVVYFAQAVVDDELGTVFFIRGMLWPLAHPYFSVWAGLAIGRAIQDGLSRRGAAFRGLLVSIALHASWNAMVVNPWFSALLLGHTVLFLILVRRLRQMRRNEIALVRKRLPQLAFTHNLSPMELEIYGDIRATRQLRRRLPRSQRAAFDERRVMVTKMALRSRDG
jgi:RsiW-degrading membrane proteinase PrsW (M82 family)